MREKEYKQITLPNMVGALLNMKKSRKDEKIERIAQKCHFFSFDERVQTAHESKSTLADICCASNDLSQTVKGGLNRVNMSDINNFDKRITQLKTLKKIELLPKSCSTAFDAFYHPARAITTTIKNYYAKNTPATPKILVGNNTLRKSTTIIVPNSPRIGSGSFLMTKNAGVESISSFYENWAMNSPKVNLFQMRTNVKREFFKTTKIYQQHVRPKMK